MNWNRVTLIFFRDITFSVLYEKIKGKQDFQEAISATLSHEVRGPLNVMNQKIEQIESRKDVNKDKELKNDLSIMKISCKLLNSLMLDMIDWT